MLRPDPLVKLPFKLLGLGRLPTLWEDISLKAGISTISFDRGGYLYHGRVKSLAEGAREAGLKF